MSLVVNHNLMAANAARNLNSHYDRLSTSTQRLSSGLRINSAADDAAGLAIRELMKADIATLHQGIRNANDAISLIQTADGALQVIDEKLVRMKELAEQAATGTYTSTQRLIIDSEYQAMASEITRIANATDFNGIKLLDGTLSAPTHDGSGMESKGKLKIHFGTGNDSAEDYYYITIGDCTAAAFGVGDSTTYNSTMDRAKAEFASAIYGEFGQMATGTLEERAAYQEALDTVENMFASIDNDFVNKYFDGSKTLEEQYKAYNDLFTRPTAAAGSAVNMNIGETPKIYSSVEELQKAALEYYKAECANGMGQENSFDTDAHAKALNNVAKMFDNAIIIADGGRILPQLTEEEFKNLSNAERESLKVDLAMAALNTTVNGTNAQQSSLTEAAVGRDFVNYDSMAGVVPDGNNGAASKKAYTEEEFKSFINNLDYGYEAAKTRTLGINKLTDMSVGKYLPGTSVSATEFGAGTVLQTSGILKNNVILKDDIKMIPGDPNALAEGSNLADGSILAVGSKIGKGTEIGDGTTLTSDLDLTSAGTILGAGTRLGANSSFGAATQLGEGTELTTGTNLTAGILGTGTILGNGSKFDQGIVIPNDTKLGNGTVFGDDITLSAGTILGTGTKLVDGSDLDIGTKIGDGTILGNGTILAATNELNAGTILGDGTILGNGTTLGAGTKLGDGTEIGDNTTVGTGTKLGEGTVLGIGTVITDSNFILQKGSSISISYTDATGTHTTTLSAAEGITLSKLFNDSGLGGTLVDATAVSGTTVGLGGYTVNAANTLTLRGTTTLKGESVFEGGSTTLTNGATIHNNNNTDTILGGSNNVLNGSSTFSGGTKLKGITELKAGGNNFKNGTTLIETELGGLVGSNIKAGSSFGDGSILKGGGNSATSGGATGYAVGANGVVFGNRTILGDETEIETGSNASFATGTTLKGVSTGVIGTFGAGTKLGTATTTVAGATKLGAGTVFGIGNKLGEDINIGSSMKLSGKTTLYGPNTVIKSGSTLAANSELGEGSIVPEGATVLNTSLFTGTNTRNPDYNGIYGGITFDAATNTIKRTNETKFGSFQSAIEKMLTRVGTETAGKINMDGNNIKTQENAQRALAALDKAIVQKDNIRAHIGALQNRLENTITNLTTQAENLQASESRISDVDVATEMTEFTRNQILTQSAVAMLAQANSLPQMAMKLIGG